MFSVDNAFIIKTWDPKMEKLCYKSAQNVIGSTLEKIFPMLCEKVALVFVDGKKKTYKRFSKYLFSRN